MEIDVQGNIVLTLSKANEVCYLLKSESHNQSILTKMSSNLKVSPSATTSANSQPPLLLTKNGRRCPTASCLTFTMVVRCSVLARALPDRRAC